VTQPVAEIGIFGGSGFYTFLDDVEQRSIDTPYGAPSAPVAVGSLGSRRVAFLPRHGLEHEYLPHQIPNQANLWAMRTLGVRRVLGPCAAGSLQAGIEPGDFVVCDQLFDRTWGRSHTYYDAGEAHHVAFADPYCPDLSAAVVAAARDRGIRVHAGGTVVVIPGPRFSTRAESFLARELGMCYSTIALVTDYDTGVEDDPSVEPVTMDAVFAFFEQNLHRVRELLAALAPTLPVRDLPCACAEAVGPLPEDQAHPGT
jgi:5'-methylthioadenosine phosphorylase